MLKILLLLIPVIVFLFTPTNVHAKQVDVQATDAGFVPKSITVYRGDSVKFINNSGSPSWPASNIHPSHAVYPEFDSQKPLQPGEFWQFTFDKPGNWRFHDHLKPALIGDIRVIGEKTGTIVKKKLLSRMDEFQIGISKVYYFFFKNQLEEDFAKVDMQNAAEDYPQVTGSWMKLVGIEKTLDKLLKDTGNGANTDCHQESHNIGRIAYQLFGSEAFTHGSSVCHSGYYHGMIEQFFQEEGNDQFPQKTDEICSNFKTSFSRFECLHGIGHGIMAYLDYDLPLAIDECQTLKDDYSKESCYGGVFMENIVVAEGKGAKTGHVTKWVSDDPYFPCSGIEQEERLQMQCYLIQTARMLDLNDYDFERIIPICSNAPENMRNICFQSLGRDAAGQVLRNPQKILSICRKTPENYFNDCLKGSLFVIIEFWGERMEDQPHGLCKLLDETSEKEYCYQLLGNRLTGVLGENPERIKQVCNYSEPEYVNTCMSSNLRK